MKNYLSFETLKYLGGALIIGALGSGLWDLFLKGVFIFLGNSFINLISLFYSGYIDLIYSHVGGGYDFLVVLPTLLLFLFVILFGVFFLFFYHFRVRRIINGTYESSKNRVGQTRYIKIMTNPFTVWVIMFTAIILYSDLLIKGATSYTACTTIERNMDIIKPYVSEHEFNLLRSEYRLVNDKTKFKNLVTKINKVADTRHIELPGKVFLGIK